MNWLNHALTNSLVALWGWTEFAASAREERIEQIRDLMLKEMGIYGTVHFPKVARKVRHAAGALSLWYTRCDVMTVLSAEYGETAAQKKIDHISSQFKGLLPAGMSARPSNLRR